MTEADIAKRQDKGPDYEYGNKSPIEVIRLQPYRQGSGFDPHASLEIDNPGAIEAIPFTEKELEEKLVEIADNYRRFADPKSQENNPKEFGGTIVNADKLKTGRKIMFMTTQGSSLYDEEGNPNNEGNALELAYTALKYPDDAILLVESPGTGNSADLTDEEYKRASQDGRLVEVVIDDSGRVVNSEVTETLQALARALADSGYEATHLSSNASGAHFASALAVELPSIERVFAYNATNISDRHPVVLSIATFIEIATQRKYEKASRDPLRLTDERKDMARLILGSARKSRVAQARAQTHNPLKMWRQQRIFSRGNRHGQAAAVHAVAGQLRHPGAKTSYVFPEFAAQYKSAKDFEEFAWWINRLGGHAVAISDIESLKIPLGQYGHSHYPSVRQTLEGYAFNR